MKKINILIGAPGSGKGSFAKRIMDSKSSKFIHFSTGDLFRKAMNDNSPLGQQVKEYMDNNVFVPDDIVNQVIKDFLEENHDEKILLDGYPRNVNQTQFLLETLKDLDLINNTAFLFLNCDYETAKTRILSRRVCPKCSSIYNTNFKPPKVDNVCDLDGCMLITRDDDTEEKFEQRYKDYKNSTSLIALFISEEPIETQIFLHGKFVDSIINDMAKSSLFTSEEMNNVREQLLLTPSNELITIFSYIEQMSAKRSAEYARAIQVLRAAIGDVKTMNYIENETPINVIQMVSDTLETVNGFF